MRKKQKVPLLLWAVIGIFGWGMYRRWRSGWLGRALNEQQAAQLRAAAPSNFRVKLQDGREVVLNNSQLALQIEKGAAVSWVPLKSTT